MTIDAFQRLSIDTVLRQDGNYRATDQNPAPREPLSARSPAPLSPPPVVPHGNNDNIDAQETDASEEEIASLHDVFEASFFQPHMDVVRDAVKAGADLEETSRRFAGWTALHLCCELDDNVEIAKYLLSQGANIERRTAFGDSALVLASYYGQWRVVKMLLEHKANVHAQDGRSVQSLQCAARKFLMRRRRCRFHNDDVANKNDDGPEDETHAHWSCGNEDCPALKCLKIITALVAQGVSVAHVGNNKRYQSALAYAKESVFVQEAIDQGVIEFFARRARYERCVETLAHLSGSTERVPEDIAGYVTDFCTGHIYNDAEREAAHSLRSALRRLPWHGGTG
ncbi:MAG: hypothetical protein MHM6MM_003434 [Cercozoa sp. M6MM]